jgi:hypothetical protein
MKLIWFISFVVAMFVAFVTGHCHGHGDHSHSKDACPKGYDKHEKGCSVQRPVR